ncbi:MAG: glutamate racemase [Spongiibacteraceae bacterium]
MYSAPILIFDSGVGGLSIHAAIAARLPQENYVYACDNACFPYGPKPEEELVQRVHDVLDALIERYAPKLLVVACNTASTVALPRLRQHYTLPIVGVVPAIKPAAQLSKNKIIGLLATPGTVRRAYTDQLIRDFAADCTVMKIGSSELVFIAEAKLRGDAVDIAQLRRLMQPFFDSPHFSSAGDVDTIVLGCTHFPLLKDELAAAVPHTVNWVDSGTAIAERVLSLLGDVATPAAGADVINTAVFTRAGADVDALRGALLQRAFAHTDILPVH